MARRNRRLRPAAPSPVFGGGERRETWRNELYVVRPVAGAAAVKVYLCPGCHQEIRVGVPHVVAWPTASLDAGERRHWHTPCWAARERRGPASR